MGTVDEFKTAMREFNEAKADFAKMMKFLRQFETATQYNINPFLTANFGMRPTAQYGRGDLTKHAIDLSAWPTKEELVRRATRVATAFNQVREAYAQLPDGDREFMNPPPGGIDLER